MGTIANDEISDVQRSLSTNRVKASRTLPFSNNISTPRDSSFGSRALLAWVNPLSHVVLPLQNAGPSYRVFPHVQTTQDFLPPLTSTRNSLKGRLTLLKNHLEAFSENSVNFFDWRAFSLFYSVPGKLRSPVSAMVSLSFSALMSSFLSCFLPSFLSTFLSRFW